jgi:hypothetical protein
MLEEKMKVLKLHLILAIGCWLVLCGPAAAQDAGADASELAKKIQNPLAAMITLPLQANYNTGAGPYERTLFNMNVQPVIPITGENWNVIARTIIPINSVPRGETDSTFGVGDTNLSLYFSPAKSGKLTWGFGPSFGLPTASNPEVLGSGKLGMGPSAIVFLQAGRWTMGGVATNVWSVVGDKDRDHYNQLTLQYFVNFNFGGGWALGTAPILGANWKAEAGNKWTIPWGLQVSKVTRLGSRPVNLLFGYYANSKHPEGSADSQVRIQINFLFPAGTN